MTSVTAPVCPSNLWQGLIARVSSVTAAGKDIAFPGIATINTFLAVVCYYLCHHSPRNLFTGIRGSRRAVNERHRTIQICVDRERYEMRVQWIEVCPLFAVRYTCLILVYFIARN
jgi:hypothetical protein